jgi:V/A-type H+/Na+-transporting ATPase subunit A
MVFPVPKPPGIAAVPPLLEQIVRLIGEDALASQDRLVLVIAEMIKNGFLQQNAFDAIDMYSVPEKQIQILLLIMSFYKKALECLKAGVSLTKIISLPVREEIVRAKLEVANDKLDGLKTIEGHLEDQMAEVMRIYRKADFV